MKLRFLIFIVFICLPAQSEPLSAETAVRLSFSISLSPSDPEINLSDIKNIPDLYFECQVAEMSLKSTVPLFYNSLVREYIEIYLLGRANQIPELSRLSDKYFPMFENQLEKAALPDELKYIPVIESALNPLALSPSGALGLWQFKSETGRSLGLQKVENLDERCDPEKSTQAACEYLRYLYTVFGDWQLSLLAYHAGPSTIKNAINKAGGKTSYKDIYAFLPLATQRYLPSYIAVMYVLNNYKNHI
jgi:membrane-bound lytic murein transglycosylase D